MGESWKPERGETYYWIDSIGNIGSYEWCGDSTDRGHYKRGNCFKTKEKAEAVSAKISAMLLSLDEPTDCVVGRHVYFYDNPDWDPTNPDTVFDYDYIREGTVTDITKNYITIIDSDDVADAYPTWAVAVNLPLLVSSVGDHMCEVLEDRKKAIYEASVSFLGELYKNKDADNA